MQGHNKTLNHYLKRSASLAAAFIMLSFTTGGYSSVITIGCSEAESCTLEELFAGGSITVNDKIFENWVLDFNTLVYDFSQVVVTGLNDGGYDPGPGLRYEFNGNLSIKVSHEIELDTVFYYTVATTEEPAFIKDASLTLIDYQFENVFGGVGVNEFISQCQLHPWPYIGDLSIGANEEGAGFFDSVEFTRQPSLFVSTELLLYAYPTGLGGIGSAGIESFEQRFSQTIIPVPPALWLFGSGLLGLVGIARRKKPS